MTNDQAAMTNEEGFEQRNGVDQWDLVIADLLSLIHLSLDRFLRDLPDGGEVLEVTIGVEEFVAVAFDFEEPAGTVLVDVDRRGVFDQGLVEACELARHRSVQRGLGLLAFDLADLLAVGEIGSGGDIPIKKVDVLQQAHRVGCEAKAEASLVDLAGPHVIARVLTVGWKLGLELAHHEGEALGFGLWAIGHVLYVYRTSRCSGSKNAGSKPSTRSRPSRVSSTRLSESFAQPSCSYSFHTEFQ